MVYTQSRIHLWKRNSQTSLGFWDTNGSPNLDQTTRLSYSKKKTKKKKKEKLNKKNKNCRIVNFAVPADHWVKLKESEKRYKY